MFGVLGHQDRSFTANKCPLCTNTGFVVSTEGCSPVGFHTATVASLEADANVCAKCGEYLVAVMASLCAVVLDMSGWFGDLMSNMWM